MNPSVSLYLYKNRWCHLWVTACTLLIAYTVYCRCQNSNQDQEIDIIITMLDFHTYSILAAQHDDTKNCNRLSFYVTQIYFQHQTDIFIFLVSLPPCFLHKIECYLCFMIMGSTGIKRKSERQKERERRQEHKEKEAEREDEREKNRKTDKTRQRKDGVRQRQEGGHEMNDFIRRTKEMIITVYTVCSIFFTQLLQSTAEVLTLV